MTDALGREITYLRLSVTERCNLRCRYCMPADGPWGTEDALTEEELLRAVEAAASLGVTKLRITGGEPLLRGDLLSICRRASAVAGIREVCLTTNGSLLPGLAVPLREAGVSRVNLSLDTLDPKKYAYITRRGRLDDALAGLEAALDAGFPQVKVNAVLIGGFNDDEIEDLADLTRRYPVDLRFIERMPMPAAGFGRFVPCARVLDRLPDARPEPGDGGVARLYRLPGAMGRLGLISPVSGCFCESCSRLRLTADGMLKPCLHAPGEISIRGLDRDAMAERMRRAILDKPARHGLSGGAVSRAGRSMNRIGG